MTSCCLKYIEALPCKGYFVCKIEELVEVRQKGGGSFVEPGDTGKDRYQVDFSPRGIDLDSFPFIRGGKSAGIHWWMITRRCLRQETPRGKGLSGLP